MSWNNRTFKGDENGGASYPFIQFMSNGRLMEPSQPRGKFAITKEQVLALANGDEKDALPQNAKLLELVFRNGKRVPAYVAEGLVVVPILTRFAWIKDGFRLPGYAKGAHGKMQLLCYVANNSHEFIGPLLLTASGLASKDLKNALRGHRTAVRKATQDQAPAYAFSMLLVVGDPIMRGSQQQSRACPIILDQQWEVILTEQPDNHYIGDDLADEIENRWSEYKKWAAAWSQSGPNGDGEVVEDADASQLPAPDRSQPSTAAQKPPWDNVPVPFKNDKYRTIGEIHGARDAQALQGLVVWCKKHGHSQVAVSAGAALENLQRTPF